MPGWPRPDAACAISCMSAVHLECVMCRGSLIFTKCSSPTLQEAAGVSRLIPPPAVMAHKHMSLHSFMGFSSVSIFFLPAGSPGGYLLMLIIWVPLLNNVVPLFFQSHTCLYYAFTGSNSRLLHGFVSRAPIISQMWNHDLLLCWVLTEVKKENT